ncbi:hypothetical protein DCAR_0310987 [Daucus carota subsp. sativus]|uniref:Uncharacterized protein n=1 Tax=Daucus carota subsp. sativus TaxID=79200 RepID=A0A161XWP5_DAUCS|nr:PREDICTED: uncharacterized protein LOC108211171 [Daucus carota subsp. sativus]WOG91737.1 hypothetical protein DCAR_0310987 [Daucus carota subsp. sativus]
MGVGGLKGHSTVNVSGSGRAGWPYGLMLLLFVAFGALLLGVIAIHKHKERRDFHLVIKDRDLQLHSLHLQLQTERDFSKKAKQKSEELNSELYNLRNQKSELNGKIREMQSTISSLKEEHKAIESALGEKQKEIDLMKEREKHEDEQNNQGSFLAKVLSLKEAEFENLKSNLQLPVRDGNFNFRYPNSPMNPTNKISIGRDETVSTNKENGGQLHNYFKTADVENSTNGEDGRETENAAASRKISGEPRILKRSQQEFQQNNTADENPGKQVSYKFSTNSRGMDMDTQKRNTNGTEVRTNSGSDFKKTEDAAAGVTLAANTKFGAKSVVDFEKPKNVDNAILAANTKFGNNDLQEKNIVGSTRGKVMFRNEREGKQKERPGEAELLKLFKEKGQSLGLDIRTGSDENMAKFKSFNPVLWKEGMESKGDTKVGSGSKTKKDHSSSFLKSSMNSENRISEWFSQVSDEIQVNKKIDDKGSSVTSDDKKKKPKGIVYQEAQANGNPHRTERSRNGKAANPKKRHNADKNANIAEREADNTYEG